MDRLSSALFDAALFALQSRFVEDLKAFYDADPDCHTSCSSSGEFRRKKCSGGT